MTSNVTLERVGSAGIYGPYLYTGKNVQLTFVLKKKKEKKRLHIAMKWSHT